jgi:membrane protein DedA with SNARE-associated domain
MAARSSVALAAVPLLVASLTGPLVKLATNVIGSIGLAGVALLTATSGVVGLPGTEPVMLFAGFNVYQHKLTLVGIIIAGIVGDTIGATVAYVIGYRASRELVEHQGRRLHVNPARIARAHRWFDRWGAPVIAISRLIPLGRAVFPYAAGVAEMPYVKFITFAIIGSIAWMTGLGLLGREVGADWQTWRKHLEYVDYVVIALVVLGLAYLLLRRLRRRPPPAVDAVSE